MIEIRREMRKSERRDEEEEEEVGFSYDAMIILGILAIIIIKRIIIKRVNEKYTQKLRSRVTSHDTHDDYHHHDVGSFMSSPVNPVV